jgi:hypothetical protein
MGTSAPQFGEYLEQVGDVDGVPVGRGGVPE